jgi:dihydrofolate reductase
MRRVIVQELVSLDGFAAGPDDELDFLETVTDYSEVDADNLGMLEDVDTILLGARTYRLFVDYWPTAEGEPVAESVNTIPKVVFSATLDRAPWGRWEPARVVRADATAEVAGLKQEPGGDMIVWGSLSVAQSLLRAGLVDVLQLRVLPIVLGQGRPLIPPELGTLRLHLVEAKPYRSGIVSLTYQTAA